LFFVGGLLPLFLVNYPDYGKIEEKVPIFDKLGKISATIRKIDVKKTCKNDQKFVKS